MAATLPGYFSRESEFVGGLTGACGPNALAMVVSRATQRYVSTVSVYQTMRTHGLCDGNGISDMGQLVQAARLLGLPVTATRGYGGDTWPQWRSFLDSALTRGPVVFELAHGQNLRDAVTGQGENAVGLRYHFIAVLGKDATGRYLCADGDNYARGNVLQTYSAATLAAAAPCAALAIAQVAKIVVAPVPAPKPAPKPAWVVVKGPDGSAWYQQTATGHKLGGGLYAALKAAKLDTQPLLTNEVPLPHDTRYSAVAVSGPHVLAWDHQAHGLTTPDVVAEDLLKTLPGAA